MSMYRIPPAAVVHPQSEDDLAEVMRVAAHSDLDVTFRGGGSGTGGAALGNTILVSLEDLESARQVSDTDEIHLFRAGAAVRHDTFQRHLREHGFYMPADPSSGQLSFIGGNIATKASGAHALRTGAIDRYVHSMRIMLTDGTVIDTADPRTVPGELATGVDELRRAVASDPGLHELRARLTARRGWKYASGYNVATLLSPAPTAPAAPAAPMGEVIAQLMCGSVGTLAAVLDVTLRAVEVEAQAITLLVPAKDRGAACDFALECVGLGAAAVELVDAEATAFIRDAGGGPARGGDHHYLYVELRGVGGQDSRQAILRAAGGARGVQASEIHTAETPEEQEELWKLRKRLLLLIRQAPAPYRALSVVNDVGVPTASLSRFIADAAEIFSSEGLRAPIYGHAGSGNLHLRPLFDTSRSDLRDQIRRVADRIYDRVIELNGTITAEHGMGRLRAPYLEAEWGSAAVHLFRRIKSLFDPQDVLSGEAMFFRGDITEHLDV